MAKRKEYKRIDAIYDYIASIGSTPTNYSKSLGIGDGTTLTTARREQRDIGPSVFNKYCLKEPRILQIYEERKGQYDTEPMIDPRIEDIQEIYRSKNISAELNSITSELQIITRTLKDISRDINDIKNEKMKKK